MSSPDATAILSSKAEEIMGKGAIVQAGFNGFIISHVQFKDIEGNFEWCVNELKSRETYLRANAGLGSRKREHA